jgi:hypothetical protein
VRQLPLI